MCQQTYFLPCLREPLPTVKMRTFKVGWLHLHCIEACIAALVTVMDIKRSSSIRLEHWETHFRIKALLLLTIGVLLNNNMLFLDNLVHQHPFPESLRENITATCIAALLFCYRRSCLSRSTFSCCPWPVFCSMTVSSTSLCQLSFSRVCARYCTYGWNQRSLRGKLGPCRFLYLHDHIVDWRQHCSEV